VKISFVAGFGPIVRDMEQSRAFWEDAQGSSRHGAPYGLKGSPRSLNDAL
jgi:hypothetical protein